MQLTFWIFLAKCNVGRVLIASGKRASTPSCERLKSLFNAGFMTIKNRSWGGLKRVLHYVERRLLSAHRYTPNFEHLESSVADVAMVDVLGMCLYASPLEIWMLDASMSSFLRGTIYIFGVGFEVAYLYWRGKFEGQECEISSKYGSHAFFVLCSSR